MSTNQPVVAPVVASDRKPTFQQLKNRSSVYYPSPVLNTSPVVTASPDVKRVAVDVLENVPKRFKSEYSDTITVIVGAPGSERKFSVDHGRICSQSAFFRAACSKDWAEGQEKVVKLPDQSPLRFQVYLEWLWDKTDLQMLTRIACEQSKTKQEVSSEATPPLKARNTYQGFAFPFLGKLWILGDYLLDIDFKNAALVALHKALNEDAVLFAWNVANALFNETPVNCALHNFLAHWIADRPFVQSPGLMKGDAKLKDAVLAVLLEQKRNTPGFGTLAPPQRDITRYLEVDVGIVPANQPTHPKPN